LRRDEQLSSSEIQAKIRDLASVLLFQLASFDWNFVCENALRRA
jgi:hypothetical protein